MEGLRAKVSHGGLKPEAFFADGSERIVHGVLLSVAVVNMFLLASTIFAFS